ncbi:MAG: hypothetical protein CSA68_07340 [Rhodobacterales bacterium]|nr:MAG: hypothetical protein CSA68_07340 [Rhodobacterales bacterium]
MGFIKILFLSFSWGCLMVDIRAADQETIVRLQSDLRRLGDAFERKAARADRLEKENLALRMRLIRLRRFSGVRGVSA